MDGITQLDVRQMHTNLTHAQNEPNRHPSTRVTTGAFAPASDWATRSGISCASSERSLEHNSLFEGAVPECPAVTCVPSRWRQCFSTGLRPFDNENRASWRDAADGSGRPVGQTVDCISRRLHKYSLRDVVSSKKFY